MSPKRSVSVSVVVDLRESIGLDSISCASGDPQARGGVEPGRPRAVYLHRLKKYIRVDIIYRHIQKSCDELPMAIAAGEGRMHTGAVAMH